MRSTSTVEYLFTLQLNVRTLLKRASGRLVRHLVDSESHFKSLDLQLRLPILDLALPVLRQMSARQYAKFREIIQILVEADARLFLFEFALQEIITHRLGATFVRHKKEIIYKKIEPLALDAVNILSKLAHVGHSEEIAAQAAFKCGWVKLPIKDSRWEKLPALM